MDWKRFKTIIILALLLINVFLGAYLMKIKLSDNKVNRETRMDVISVLKEGNINLSEKTFPENRKTYSACYVTRVLEDDEAFLKKLAGEGGQYKATDEVFEISRAEKEEIDLSEEGVRTALRKFMKDCGIYEDIYKEEKIEISEGAALASFILSYDDCEFFDSFIDFVVTHEGVKKITGKNIIKAEEELSSYEDSLMPIEGIIISLPNHFKPEKSVNVEEISFGYYLGKSAGVYKSVLALPVWEIKFEDGSSIYYDARNGSVIKM